MSRKPVVIMPIASALAALAGAPAVANAVPSDTINAEPAQGVPQSTGKSNMFYTIGQDLLGFVVTQQADGTMIAAHGSHSSHSSHASHVSSR